MTKFQGTYFDGKSSRAYPVTVFFDGVYLQIQGENNYPALAVLFLDCTITPPLGKTTRSIKLPNGAQCETNDLKAISVLERRTNLNYGMRVVHFLESRWKMVVCSLIGLIFCIGIFITYGIPLLAKKIAYSLPPEVTNELSEQTLKILDGRFLKPTELSQEKIAELQEIFIQLNKEIDMEFNCRLEFRKSPIIGPNAFALPSGLIIMTDELVKLADNNRELEGIFIHEIAHVKKRHGLRSIIQNAGIFLLISTLVGDITSITSTAASLPTLLAQSNYSRKFEEEADRFAVLYFIQKEWNIKPYQDILLRITKDMPNYPGESLLSSHPLTNDRTKYIQALEESMAKKKP